MKSFVFEHKWKIVFICGVLALGGWYSFNDDISPKDLEVSRIDFSDSKPVLSPREIRKDIKHLIYAFESVYAGKKVYQKEYAQMISDLQILATTDHEMPTADYFSKVESVISRIPDGHLRIYGRGYENKEAPVSREPSNLSLEPPLSLYSKKVAVISMPTFVLEPDKVTELFDTVEEKIKTSQAIVFDLRGNVGGYGEIPYRIAAMLWGEQYREGSDIQYYPSPVKQSGQIWDPVMVALGNNFQILAETKRGKRLDEQKRRSLLDKALQFNEYEYGSTRKKTTFNKYGFAPTHSVEDNSLTYEDLHLKERGFNKPIFVVYDDSCASACEVFLESLEAHPFVKTVGSSNSQGATQFGAVGPLVLPESHFTVMIASSYVTYKDGRVIEKKGYAPQLRIKNSEDPFKKIATLIK